MSESSVHIDLVGTIIEYIGTILQPDLMPIVMADAVGYRRPTTVVAGYIPDVYYWRDRLMIIGEAKTVNDFARPHSQNQFKAYLEQCEAFTGEAVLIVSVPWMIASTARNYFRRLKSMNHYNTKIVILNETGQGDII